MHWPRQAAEWRSKHSRPRQGWLGPRRTAICAACAPPGWCSQQADTSLYQLGPQAIAIGLAALRGVNPVAEVCNALPTLRDKINQTVTAAVWSEAGPILVAMQESDHWLTMNIRIGSRLPVLTTAIGRIFLAYLPEPDVAALVAAERKTGASPRNRTTVRGRNARSHG